MGIVQFPCSSNILLVSFDVYTSWHTATHCNTLQHPHETEKILNCMGTVQFPCSSNIIILISSSKIHILTFSPILLDKNSRIALYVIQSSKARVIKWTIIKNSELHQEKISRSDLYSSGKRNVGTADFAEFVPARWLNTVKSYVCVCLVCVRRVISHIWVSVVTRVNMSRPLYARVLSRIEMSHAPYTNKSYRIYEWVTSDASCMDASHAHVCLSLVAYRIGSRSIYKWVISHIWMSHVSYIIYECITHVCIHESCRVYKWMHHMPMYAWVLSRIELGHSPHTNELHSVYERVSSHIWMSPISCIIYECVTRVNMHESCSLWKTDHSPYTNEWYPTPMHVYMHLHTRKHVCTHTHQSTPPPLKP